jgi:pimeloyl-ACP methyl ester carboxylesterase
MRILLSLVIAAALGAPALVVAQDQFFESNGVRIHYREEGAGEPIVLIHGLGNSLESAWIETGVISAFAKDHRVIAFDSRGHGKSGKPSEPAAYGLEMPRDVVRLLDHLKVRRAHVVGFSQGAAIVGKLLTISSERVITASFVGAPARVNWAEADEKFAAAQVAQFREDPPFRSQILRGVPPGQPTPSEDTIREQSRNCSVATTPSLWLLSFVAQGRHLSYRRGKSSRCRIQSFASSALLIRAFRR